jgi:hypothetical protein|tara:strand:+ start:916 stop:1152 length:237 start_codon:yes stop_codon:yes gene_type:complete
MKPNTHKARLYNYLQSNSITTKDAIIHLGIADLQGTIRDLKEIGIEIVTRDIKVPTRYSKLDGSTKYAYVREYSLKAH